jgi:hypothetical protein
LSKARDETQKIVHIFKKINYASLQVLVEKETKPKEAREMLI